MARVQSDLVARFAHCRVVVVGDVMLDRYLVGRVRRISPEAPVPIVEIERTIERPGGAANVAANLRRLGAVPYLVGVIGNDPDGRRLVEILREMDIAPSSLITVSGRPTTVKTRIVAAGQQIARVDRETAALLDAQTLERLLEAYHRVAAADATILSDYAKGVLGRSLCRAVISHSRTSGRIIVVDPKGRDYERYTGATAITPNLTEAAQALGVDVPERVSLDEARRFFLDRLGLAAAIITRGERGMVVLEPGRPPLELPASARDIADVTGAGDTVVSTLALALSVGATIEEAARLANTAAGVVVGKAGTAVISVDELIQALGAEWRSRSRRTA